MDDLFAQNRERFRREQEHIVRAKRKAQEQASQSRAAPDGYFGSEKSVRRMVKVILGIWVAVMIVLVASFIGFSGCSSSNNSPAWWCEQAKNTGMENPPGC